MILENAKQSQISTPTLSEIRISYPQSDLLSPKNLGQSVLQVRSGGNLAAQIRLVAIDQLSASFDLDLNESAESELIAASAVKSLLGKLRTQSLPPSFELIVSSASPFERLFRAFDFKRGIDGTYSKKLDGRLASTLAEIKLNLLNQTKGNELVGRGYKVDVSSYSRFALELLMREYNEVAWGYKGWARHSEVAADEIKLIADLADPSETVVEIGAGSGRVTRILANHFRNVDATDYSLQIVNSLSSALAQSPNYKNITVLHDDVVSCNLPKEKYDKVFFLENGLGGLLKDSDRAKAIINLLSILRPGGQLVVGVRSLGDKSVDHLMIASQDPTFMGVYRTFAASEIDNLVAGKAERLLMREGDARPAGGRQIFLIYRKFR